MKIKIWILLSILPTGILAQESNTPPGNDMRAVMERLDKLEAQNQQLENEVKSLREMLAATGGAARSSSENTAVEQRVEVAEHRIDEQAQTKVEASQRFPIRITGALLFNAFSNRGAANSPFYAATVSGPEQSGATIRQTLLGLEFDGPSLPWNGKASGSLTLDLGGASYSTYGATLNIRRAVLDLNWTKRSIMFGQDKPLISRRAPDSLAEVLVPPLSYSGNPWVWTPQVRYVERLGSNEQFGVNIESSALQTDEGVAFIPGGTNASFRKARPGFEQRVEFHSSTGDKWHFEVAPGFHVSTTHIAGFSVPSQFATLDWLIRPSRMVQITGFFATGTNIATLGGFTNGVYLAADSKFRGVRSAGGWTQVALHLSPRLTLNSLAGVQAPRIAGLERGALSHDYSFGSNLIFRLAPNILIGVEALQERTGYVGQSHSIKDHYDLAIGYLF